MDADKVYLTFDDGPVPEATPWVLDQLATYGAKGTFFCIGNNVRKYPDIYDRILAEGHTVGNHTYNHSNGWKTPTRQYIAGVEAAAAVIEGWEYHSISRQCKSHRQTHGSATCSIAALPRE